MKIVVVALLMCCGVLLGAGDLNVEAQELDVSFALFPSGATANAQPYLWPEYADFIDENNVASRFLEACLKANVFPKEITEFKQNLMDTLNRGGIRPVMGVEWRAGRFENWKHGMLLITDRSLLIAILDKQHIKVFARGLKTNLDELIKLNLPKINTYQYNSIVSSGGDNAMLLFTIWSEGKRYTLLDVRTLMGAYESKSITGQLLEWMAGCVKEPRKLPQEYQDAVPFLPKTKVEKVTQ